MSKPAIKKKKKKNPSKTLQVFSGSFVGVYVPKRVCGQAHGLLRMLQMVRTLAQFSIALEEMNESGETTGDEGGGGGGERDGGGGGGGEEVVDRDAVDQFRNNGNGHSSGNLNGNGLCAGSPQSNGEVD